MNCKFSQLIVSVWVLVVSSILSTGARAQSFVPPANDDFANAAGIGGISGSVAGSITEATKELGEPNHAQNQGGQSIWYRWTAPASGQASFDTTGSGLDTTLGVYTGNAVANLTEVASNNDEALSIVTSKLVFTAQAGVTYHIAVDYTVESSPNAFNVQLNYELAVPEIVVEQPPGTDIPDAGTQDFGSIPITTNTSRTFTITNIGNVDLTGLGTFIDGPDAGDFSVSINPVSPVNPGKSTTITVRFAPFTPGTKNAALHIANNDPDESPFDIVLRGTALAPEISVEQAAGAVIPDGSTQSFSDVIVGGNTALTFTIRNSGTSNLTGLNYTIDGAHPGDFSVTSNPTAPVIPSSNTSITVRFAPTTNGPRVATIHIASNDQDENPYDIVLNGSGLAPEIAVEQPAGAELANNDTVLFRNVENGATATKTITIRNRGTADLTGLGISINGPESADFTILSGPNAPVPPGGTTTFTVGFSPSALGPRAALLHIASNDADENPFNLLLTGTSVTPEIVVQEPVGTNVANNGSRGFGKVLVGTSQDLVFNISNTGTSKLTIPGLAIDGPDAADFSVVSIPNANVPPGGNTNFKIRFKPSSTGPKNAALHILNNDANESQFNITLTGRGIAPEIAVQEAAGSNVTNNGTRGFGNILVGTGGTLTFFIKNKGSADLNGLGLLIDGPDAADFSVVSNPTAPVAPGSDTSFTIRFAPTRVGPKLAAVHIASNDADESPFNILLLGGGIAPEIVVQQPVGTNLGNNGARGFGNVLVGSNDTLTFAIRNAGSSDLNGLGLLIDGPNAADFSIVSNPSAPVAPGGRTNFTVLFSPSSVGPKTAAIHIASDDANENPFNITLTGGGIAPEIAIEQPAGKNVPNFGTRIFGNLLLGKTRDLTFTIANKGSSDLTGLGMNIAGPSAAEFEIISYPSGPLKPGASTSFTVRFAPTKVGPKAAAIVIANNDDDESPFNILLVGSGLAPEIVVRQQPSGTNIVDGTASGFGKVPVGENRLLGFTIGNAGTYDLTGLGIVIDGPDAADFSIAAKPSASVSPGGITGFAVRFSPSSPGPKNAAIHIASNDANESPFDIQLSGSGTAPEIAVQHVFGTDLANPSTEDFDSVITGKVGDPKTFTIFNRGTRDLTNLKLNISGNTEAFDIKPLAKTTLPPGAKTTFTVAFKPDIVGSSQALVRILSNDSDENPFEITLTGNGVAPDITVQEPEGTHLRNKAVREFGEVAVGTLGAAKTFTIRNDGTSDLSNIRISTDGNVRNFIISPLGKSSLKPGESTTFSANIKPMSPGDKMVVLHIISNDADEKPFDILLKGTGTAPEIAVTRPGGADIGNNGTYDFGYNPIYRQSPAKTFTIRNTGNRDLSGIAVASSTKCFTVTRKPAATLNPGASTTFDVRFWPGYYDTFSATLKITSNDPDENPFNITLSGASVIVSSSGGSSSDTSSSSGSWSSGTITTSAGSGWIKPESISPFYLTDSVHKTSKIDPTTGEKHLVLVILKGKGILDVPEIANPRRVVEVSSDLVHWHSGPKYTTVLRDDSEMLKVRDNTPLTPGVKRYIRLRPN